MWIRQITLAMHFALTDRLTYRCRWKQNHHVYRTSKYSSQGQRSRSSGTNFQPPLAFTMGHIPAKLRQFLISSFQDFVGQTHRRTHTHAQTHRRRQNNTCFQHSWRAGNKWVDTNRACDWLCWHGPARWPDTAACIRRWSLISCATAQHLAIIFACNSLRHSRIHHSDNHWRHFCLDSIMRYGLLRSMI